MSETEAPFRILPAAAADWPEIAALLAANHLPTADVDAGRAGDFLVARDARGLAGCIGGERRGHINHAGVGAGRGHGIVHGVEYWPIKMGLAALAGGNAADKICAVGDGLF